MYNLQLKFKRFLHSTFYIVHSTGYTLIELMVVITIIAIISTIIFANYKDFSTDQILAKAEGQIQSFLRLAQANAASGLKCDNSANPTLAWYIDFQRTQMQLYCVNSTAPILMNSLVFDANSLVVIQDIDTATANGSCQPFSGGSVFTVSYPPLFGGVQFFLSRNLTAIPAIPGCQIDTTNLVNIPITIQYNKNNVTCTAASCKKIFNINRGGAIDAN